MFPALNKRFWDEVHIGETAEGFEILLDGRTLKTPAKARLLIPTQALAAAVAEEWRAQGETLAPDSMPMTRRANAAIDKVVPQFNEVAALLCDYGGSDLLCYRAESPLELQTRQAAAWDPLIDWCAHELGARLRVTEGVVPVAQDPEALAALATPVRAMAPFALTGFHDLVTLSGSLVIALAAIRAFEAPEALWQRAHIDETWQRDLWGADDEADQAAERKRRDFLDGHRFYRLSGDHGGARPA